LTGSHVFGISPHGKHFLYWKDNRFQVYDLDTGTSTTLGGSSSGTASPALAAARAGGSKAPSRATGSAVSFVDTDYDHPGPKPSYGIAGYSSDGTAVIAQHDYDLWLFPLGG